MTSQQGEGCCRAGMDQQLSYSTYPAGHIFRLGMAILVLTGNCVVMRVAATVALLSVRETQDICRQSATACTVTAYSVLGSVLPILFGILTGSFAIVAAKRGLKWSFVATFVIGCILTTVSFLLNLLFNGLRHGFNIAPVLIPDILEIILFCVISLLAMIVGIICVKSLAKDRSERYLAGSHAGAAEAAAGGSSSTGVDQVEDDYAYYSNEGVAETGFSGNSSRGSSPQRRQIRRNNSRLSGRSASRVEAELTVVVENEAGKVTNYDIFTIASSD